ncbi:MAG: phenylacetate--CoA ligase family protein, partial [Haliscomenobacter sp.]
MAGFREKLYAQLPVFAQNWAISVYGYHWKQRRFGGVFEQELYGFREREAYTADQWRDYQTVQLRRLLLHAYDTVPFYREKYSAQGFHRGDFERFELEQLPLLPFLEKEELRRFGTTTLLSSKREKGGQFFSSSGSTGTPTQILYSHAFHQRVAAAMEVRVRNWAGLTYVHRRGMIGGRRILGAGQHSKPFYRYNRAEDQTYFSAYHISRENAKNYFEGILQNGVQYMTGYASGNYFLATFFEELGFYRELSAVITSSEKLTDSMRHTIRKVYGCQTFDSYSGVENCGLISETVNGEFVVHPDVGVMEFLNIDGCSVLPGEEGEIISTGFLNLDQPLIRYRIGDWARPIEKKRLLDGKEMSQVAEISGRTEDTIVTRQGKKMVRFHGLFTDMPSIIQGQVVQHSLDYFS